ncbi:M23 family metallopeptidase [Sulfitobacter sp. HNIBRBA3233]|uniref:M23 family metallopeptidase n=1 Tax=Sulfitobacter marinivivus TaxID=3158558 RepID=UPI0032DF8129
MKSAHPSGWAFLLAGTIGLCAPSGAATQELRLISPIDCDLNGPCHIQQYVDHDPGAQASDFTCSSLTYDGHKGTDFALPAQSMIADGVNVLAAAAGTVRGLRDGMPDTGYTSETADLVRDRECGNGVVLTHPGGWETQYCHLREGSLGVTNGQSVAAGDKLGEVGMSGRAQFAHVHLSVRKDGEVVDPFDPDGTIVCGTPSTETLWAEEIPTRPGGIITLGFANGVPDFETVKQGAVPPASRTGGALVIWSYLFGTRAGDTLLLRLDGPQGEVISRSIPLDRTQAQSFRAIGKRSGSSDWPAGDYSGVAEMRRAGSVLDRAEITLTLP